MAYTFVDLVEVHVDTGQVHARDAGIDGHVGSTQHLVRRPQVERSLAQSALRDSFVSNVLVETAHCDCAVFAVREGRRAPRERSVVPYMTITF